LVRVCADLDEGVAEIIGLRVGGGAGLVAGLDFHDAVAAACANEFPDAPNLFSLDAVLATTRPQRPT
jgi:hypothetical protein